MQRGDKVGIVCCSNGQKASYLTDINMLKEVLVKLGLVPVFSSFIYEKDNIFSGTAFERANALMNFYVDDEISAIFDISGGDIANEILTYLDFDIISRSDKLFWGYSDLTTVINAIYTKTGHSSILYQVKNLVWNYSEELIKDFGDMIFYGKSGLTSFRYEFLQGDSMKGVLVGGNIRCLLKLAGTEFFPDMTDKVLLLESLGGSVPQITTYLSQINQMGIFKKIKGIILGTFTTLEQDKDSIYIKELVREFVGSDIPIAKTKEIGHAPDSKAAVIGKDIDLSCIRQS